MRNWAKHLHRWYKRQRNRIGAHLAREQIESWYARHASWKEAYADMKDQRDRTRNERDNAQRELSTSKQWQAFTQATIDQSNDLRRELADKIKVAPWLETYPEDYRLYIAEEEAAKFASAIILDMLKGKTVTFDLLDTHEGRGLTGTIRVDTITARTEQYHRHVPLRHMGLSR